MIQIPYLIENLLCEVTIGSEKCIIVAFCRSPDQNYDGLESFLSNFAFFTPGYFQSQPLPDSSTR